MPSWVKQQRQQQRWVAQQRSAGLLPPAPSEELRCGLCGRQCRSEAELKRHFVSLHAKEHAKRMNHLNSVTGKR